MLAGICSNLSVMSLYGSQHVGERSTTLLSVLVHDHARMLLQNMLDGRTTVCVGRDERCGGGGLCGAFQVR